MKNKRLKGNSGCQNCDLFKQSANVCVMGVGSQKSEIMIILDAPDMKAADDGLPATGKTQVLIEELLTKAGIAVSDCYITTAVKCGIPFGHKIKISEIKACNEYLEREIESVKPRYIITMGSSALKALLPKAKVTEVSGTMIPFREGIELMPMNSPGIVWREPQKMDMLQDDLNQFNRIRKGMKYELPPVNYEVVRSLKDFNRMVKELKTEKDHLSFDIETTGLSRFEDEITVLGFGMEGKQWILPMSLSTAFNSNDLIGMIEVLAEELADTDITTANGKFDNLFMRTQFAVRFNITFDTMIAAYALDENTPNGLKYTAKKAFGIPDWDLGLDSKQGKGNKEELYKYLAYDLLFTRNLKPYLMEQLEKDPAILRLFQHLLMPAFLMYENVEFEGVHINPDKFAEIDEIIWSRISEIDVELEKLRIESKYPEPINWGSTKQLGEFFFDYLELPILVKTKTGNPSTAGDVLEKMRDLHPTIPFLIERKGLKQLHSFFVDGWKKRMHNGKIYPGFNVHTVVTGRTSSKGPNLQQVPRDKRIRTLVGAPPGWTMVEADYSQVELRVVAHHSKDPKMVQVYSTGKDIHLNTAMSISGLPEEKITKELRKKAKPVNFGFVYGMGHHKFGEYAESNYGVHVSESEAKLYRQRFFEEYAYLIPWHKKQRRIATNYKQVRNLIGRLRRLPDIDSPDKQKRGDAERQAINSPIQSLASDMMLMALIEIDKELPKEHVRIVGSVHDAGLYIIRNDKLNEYVPKIKAIMEAPKLFEGTFKAKLDVPIVADVEIGNWGAGIPWDGEYINVAEDGTITLTAEFEKQYFYHPESDCVLIATSEEQVNQAYTEGCDPITKKEYRKFRKSELSKRKKEKG